MEQSESVEPRHSGSEVANHYACQKLVKTWIDNPELSSNQAVKILHGKLMEGISSYSKKGILPIAPDVYRITDLHVSQSPVDFFVKGLDVSPVMREYTHDLDEALKREPISPQTKLEETIHDSAWAYYTFVRIHPFLDGNGRVGRMILKRIMTGRRYKDIIFQSSGADGKGREAHLDAMGAVDSSGNLAHLELYLLSQLRMRYLEPENIMFRDEIDGVIQTKKREIDYQSRKRDLTEIWSGFKEISLNGVENPEYSVA